MIIVTITIIGNNCVLFFYCSWIHQLFSFVVYLL